MFFDSEVSHTASQPRQGPEPVTPGLPAGGRTFHTPSVGSTPPLVARRNRSTAAALVRHLDPHLNPQSFAPPTPRVSQRRTVASLTGGPPIRRRTSAGTSLAGRSAASRPAAAVAIA